MRIQNILKYSKCILTGCACFVFLFNAHAQNARDYEELFFKPDSSSSEGDLILRVSDINFFKNNEYFSDYIEGYTLVGYRLQPSLAYYLYKPDPNSTDGAITLEVGCHILQYGGTDKYDKVFPVATAQWQINRNLTMIMGTIDGHIGHSLPESMWEPERQIVDKPEMGVQMKLQKRDFGGELWLNWQQFIKRYDTIPEKFTVGIRADYEPSINSQLHFRVPVRVLMSHIGGQISDFTERMQSLANGSVSLQLGMVRQSMKSERRMYVDLEWQFYHAMVDKGVRPFSDGYALYPKVCYENRWGRRSSIDIAVGYWRAKNYFSLYGNPSFMSLSNYKVDIYSKRRDMLTYAIDYSYAMGEMLRFSIGSKGYFDTRENQFDYSYNISLILTPKWRIARTPSLLNTINR